MLELTERELVISLLERPVADAQSPREALTIALNDLQFSLQLGDGRPGALVRQAVQLCITNGWNGQPPPWLVRLITHFGLHILDPRITPILERVKNPPPVALPAFDPRDLRLLNNRTPFVNRDSLRSRLKDLEAPAAKARPILVVNGPTKIGKSYSVNYIEHYRNVRPDIVTHRFTFDADVGLELKPEILAMELVSSMGRSLTTLPPPFTNGDLYVRQLATWVLNEAATMQPKKNWFVLDNFHGDKVRPDTQKFLIALSDRITTGVFPDHCRLILINFDRAHFTVDPGNVDEERIQPCSAAEINRGIEEILKRAPVATTAQEVGQTLLNGLPNDQDRMTELNIRLRGLLEATLQITDILAAHPTAGYDFKEILLAMLEGLPSGTSYQPTLLQKLADLRSAAEEEQAPAGPGGS